MFWKNFIDYNKVIRIINDVYELDDVFIIYNKKKNIIEKITDNPEMMLSLITKNENLIKNFETFPEYKQHSILDFCLNIKNDTCKYKSYAQKYQVFKYNILEKLYNEKLLQGKELTSYLYQYETLKKSEKFQKFFRRTKLRSILQ